MNDAGLTPDQVDGMLSYHGGDSTPSTSIQYDLGIRPNFYMDCSGGGIVDGGAGGPGHRSDRSRACATWSRSIRSMNGYSNVRIGGTGARAAAPIGGLDLMKRPYGLISAVQQFAYTFTRHMAEYGVKIRGFGGDQGRPLHARFQQSQGADEAPRDRRRRGELAVDHQAGGAPAGLLPGNRQRDVRNRYLGRSGRGI